MSEDQAVALMAPQLTRVAQECRLNYNIYKASNNEQGVLVRYLCHLANALEVLKLVAVRAAPADAILADVSSLVQRGNEKLVAYGKLIRVNSAYNMSKEAVTYREIREELLGLLLLLICVALPQCTEDVQNAIRTVEPSAPDEMCEQARQLRRCLLRLEGVNQNVYELKPDVETFRGVLSSLQDSGKGRAQWHSVGDAITKGIRLQSDLRGVTGELEAMVKVNREHSSVPEPPTVMDDVSLSVSGTLAALQRGEAHRVLVFSCPVERVVYAMAGKAMPVTVHPCGCTVSELAVRKAAVAVCPACQQPAPAGLKYTPDVAAMRLLQAVAEVKNIDGNEVQLQNEVLGVGGQGDVVRGTYRGQPVSVKRIRMNYNDMEFMRGLWKTVAVSQVAGNACSQVCQLLGVCWLPGVVWLVQDLCEDSLVKTVQDARNAGVDSPGLPPTDLALLLVEASMALSAIHAKTQVVHKDICPGSIRLRNNTVSIIDFGSDAQVSTLLATRTDSSKGNYAPPESSIQGAKPSAKMDVYGLGATAVYAATGQPPYGQANPLFVVKQVLVEKVPMAVPERLPAPLRELLEAMVRLDPDERLDMDAVRNRSLHIFMQLARSSPPEHITPAWPTVLSVAAAEKEASAMAGGAPESAEETSAGRGAQPAAGLGVPEHVTHHVPKQVQLAEQALECHPRAAESYQLLTLRGHQHVVYSVAWSPSGDKIATASLDDSAGVWDAATGSRVLELTGHRGDVNSIAWSTDGASLATGSDDGTARLWDVADGASTLELVGHTGVVWGVAWSPDGQQVATASSDSTAALWSVGTGERVQQLRGHNAAVYSVAWSADSKSLATASADYTARVWDASTGDCLRKLVGHAGWVLSVCWAPDGQRLATGSDDCTTAVWDADSGERLQVMGSNGHNVLSVAWCPDGRRVATGALDHSAAVWDTESGERTFQVEGLGGYVHSVSWSPDGQAVAVASVDRTAGVWEIPA